MTAPEGRCDEIAAAWCSAETFLKRFFSSTSRQKARLRGRAPLEDVQKVALGHPDASVRRECLYFLDHYANEASTEVFTAALRDPVGSVRNAALHSIACETCRTAELCLSDVVPAVAGVLDSDPSPDLRTRAIPTLLRLGSRDPRAWVAVARAAEQDPDDIVRRAAGEALQGSFFAPRKRGERRQRRHDYAVPRTWS